MATSRARWTVTGAALAGVLLLGSCSVANDDDVSVAAKEPAQTEKAGDATERAVPKSASALAKSASSTADASTVRLHSTTSIALASKEGADADDIGDIDLTVGLDAAIDREGGRAQVKGDIQSGGSNGGMELPSLVEGIVTGNDVYLRLTFGSEARGWRKASTKGKGGQLADILGKSNLTDPDVYLRILEQSDAPATTVGQEELRGVATTHKRAVIDLATATKGAPAKQREAIERELDRIGLTEGKRPELPFDVWTDADGLIRRVRVSLATELSLGSWSGQVEVAQDIEFFDFGAKVEIAVPDASEVTEVDFDDLDGN